MTKQNNNRKSHNSWDNKYIKRAVIQVNWSICK